MTDPGLREKKRWRNPRTGAPLTWEQMYGTLRAAQMKARAAAKRQPAAYRTSFMRKYGLYPKTEAQKDASALKVIQGSITKAAYHTLNSPFNHGVKSHLSAARRNSQSILLKRFGLKW